MCVCQLCYKIMYVLKLWWLCELLLTCVLLILELCCLQIIVFPYWLITVFNHWGSTGSLLYTPLHFKMSGYEGIFSEILTTYWFLPLSSTGTIHQHTVCLLCWWIVYCSNSSWFVYWYVHLQIWIQMPGIKRKWMLKIFLSYL